MSKVLYGFCFLGLVGCSTIGESLTDPEGAASFHRSKNANGETVYVRKRVRSKNDYDHFALNSDSKESSPPLLALITGAADPSSTSRSSSNSLSPNAAASPPASVNTFLPKMNDDTSFAIGASVLGGQETAQFDFTAGVAGKYIDGDLGFAIVSSDRSYLGLNAGVRAHLPWKVSPFVGVGLYGGDSQTCQTNDIGDGYEEEICEKYFLFSATGDLGVQARINEVFQMRAYARYFSDIRQADPLEETLYGLSFTLLF